MCIYKSVVPKQNPSLLYGFSVFSVQLFSLVVLSLKTQERQKFLSLSSTFAARFSSFPSSLSFLFSSSSSSP